jgi:protocatechuate 3,4-dioxygenase beta subunit
MHSPLVSRLLLSMALLALTPSVALTQTVAGRVLSDAQPVAGALVVLLDAGRGQVGSVLTDQAGNFRIQAAQPGSFRLRVQRVGFESTLTPPFDLSAGETVQRELVIATVATRIEGITVGAGNPCDVRPSVGRATFRLWDEARKALDAAAFTQRDSLYSFQVLEFSHALDAESQAIIPDSLASERTHVTSWPFTSAPVERLLENGFVEQDSAGVIFYAPDGNVLLSETFLNDYCFSIAESRAEPSLVGLAFRPVSSDGPPAIRGVLWIERATRELRYLDYGYTRLHLPGGSERFATGRIEFAALPTGAWIVKRWRIRMPRKMVIESGRTGMVMWSRLGCGGGCMVMNKRTIETESGAPAGPRLATLKEDGGEVLKVLPFVRPSALATIEGVVFDSIRAEPVAGARVYISGTQYAGIADGQGRFRVTGVPAGSYELSFRHSRLTRLGFFPRPVPVELRPGETSTLRLTIRRDVEADALPKLCPDAGSSGESPVGALLGKLSDSTGAPLADVEVVVWTDPLREGRPAASSTSRQTARTGADGGYLFCGLAAGRPIHVQVRLAGEVMFQKILPAIRAAHADVRDLRTDGRVNAAHVRGAAGVD